MSTRMSIEKQSELLSKSVANCSIHPQIALEDAFGDDYCELAQAIIEPKGMVEVVNGAKVSLLKIKG